MLLKLKMLQKMVNMPSFLEEIPLHQQVLAQKRLATYYGDILVGSDRQSFKMLFDTGSCQFWIPGSMCSTERCLTHKRYLKSPTAENFNDTRMMIEYLSGKVQGDMIREQIVLGDLVINKQIIGVADEIDIPLLDDVVWDGILGLAYPNSNLKKQSIRPLFDNIMDQNLLVQKHERNQFAYFLGKETGAITFGGADMRYKEDRNEEFKWAPIADENYWTISLKDVRKEYPKGTSQRVATSRFVELNSKSKFHSKFHSRFHSKIKAKTKKACPDGCKTIVDTGTYLVYGPQEIFQNYLSDIMIDSCNNKNNLPDIIFELQGENGASFDLRLKPEDYVLHFKVDGVDDCVIGIAPDTEDTGWTFGQVFLRAYYTIFDRDENRIGFVRSNTGISPQPGTCKKKEKILKKEEPKEQKLSIIEQPVQKEQSIYSPEPAKSFIGVVADTNMGSSIQIEGFNTPKIETASKNQEQPKEKILNVSPENKGEGKAEKTSAASLHSEMDEIPEILSNDDSGINDSIFSGNNGVQNYLGSQREISNDGSAEIATDNYSSFNSDSLANSDYARRRRRRRRRLRRRRF